MPKFLEQILKKEAASKGLEGRDADRYVYGEMNNRGYMRGNKETPAGAALQKKHDEDEEARKPKAARKTRRIRVKRDRNLVPNY